MWLKSVQRAPPASGSLRHEQLPEWSTNHPISLLSCRALILHHSGMLLAHSRPKPWWVTDTEQETQDSWFVTFFKLDIAPLCHTVKELFWTFLQFEVNGCLEGRKKHYTTACCEKYWAAMWHAGIFDSYCDKIWSNVHCLPRMSTEHSLFASCLYCGFLEQCRKLCVLKQRWLMKLINKPIKNKTVIYPVSGKHVNQLNCCIKHLYNDK